MAGKTGRYAIIEQFLADGITHMFGNPGTVEQGFLDTIKDYPEMKYILTLQETIAVAIGDGYARSTKQPTVVQLHSGVGLGNGQQKLSYLPEAHTDFILALVAEEMGLLGILLVLAAFAMLMLVGTRIAQNCKDRFALLLAFGMTALLTIPAVINAAVVMGLIPTKGLTLPFLSYGRTSLIVNCAALGLLLGLARPGKPRSATTGVTAWP